MSRVAIAGGLGDLGRALLDGILETTPHHSVFLLTRKVRFLATALGLLFAHVVNA